MPEGAWQISDRKIVPPPKYEISSNMEALIHHFKLYTEGYRPPAGEVYLRTESPKGELGFYLVSDGGAKPYRMHVRAPSFANLQALPLMIEGCCSPTWWRRSAASTSCWERWTADDLRKDVKAQMREIVAALSHAALGDAALPAPRAGDEGYITRRASRRWPRRSAPKSDEVESVVTFYSMYHHEPPGAHVIKVCTSISCYLRGCDAAARASGRARWACKRGETTADGRFTFERRECLAACGMAPVLQVNGEFVENVTPERADALLDASSAARAW